MAAAKRKTNLLVIIDPQNDFHEGGKLPIAGANADCEKINNLVRTKRFDNIIVTLDTHQYVDISHQCWWVDKDGKHPDPMTVITPEDVASGKWTTARKSDLAWSTKYVKQLTANKRFQHIIWPYHCIVGTEGHGVKASLCDELRDWSLKNRRLVTYMWKGTNPKAEMYSAFKADVEVPGAPETSLNKHILDRMYGYDNVFMCGEARSHCVRYSFDDMVEYFKTKSGKKPTCILLSDCATDITGFEEATQTWMKDLSKYDFVKIAESTNSWASLTGEEEQKTDQ